MNRQYPNNATRKITITDNNQAIEDGITRSVSVEEIKNLLRDSKVEVTISNIGLYRIGWASRDGTPVSPQTVVAGVEAGKVAKVAKAAVERANKLAVQKKQQEFLAKVKAKSLVKQQADSSLTKLPPVVA